MARLASPVGAHVPVTGGLVRGTLRRAAEIGAEVVQVFVANPRGWALPKVDPDADEQFRQRCAELGLPVFVHAPYLINFGSPSPETLAKSTEALAFSMARGTSIGARGVVMHAGSAVLGNRWDDAVAQLREHVLPVLDGLDEGAPRLLIEPTAGGGGALAADADSTGRLLAEVDDERVGVCLDTCHLHAAGHDLSSVAGMRKALRAVSAAIGKGRVGLVHVNDSRDPAGSKRDRHTSLGLGTIGLGPFAELFSSPALRGVPMVVETEESQHAADIERLKALRSESV